MPSPLPGMDPFLEQPAFWSSFHSRFMVAVADAIEQQLGVEYYVEVEARTYLDDSDNGVLIGIPDAVIASGSPQQPLPQVGNINSVTTQTLSQQVRVPLQEEVTERYLEIRELATGQVITAIELLSPKNKRSGPGRVAYETKRNQVLSSLTHLIELDLLRGGKSMNILGALTPTTCRILVSPSDPRPSAELYGIKLEHPLPAIAIPLKQNDEPILLALQPIFEEVYERGRYQARIDYTQMPPAPVWSDTEQN